MKITVSHACQFRDAFSQADRQDQFSYKALNMLYEYFEDIDPDMEGCESEQDMIEAVRDYLNDNTSLVGETSSGFVYAAF